MSYENLANEIRKESIGNVHTYITPPHLESGFGRGYGIVGALNLTLPESSKLIYRPALPAGLLGDGLFREAETLEAVPCLGRNVFAKQASVQIKSNKTIPRFRVGPVSLGEQQIDETVNKPYKIDLVTFGTARGFERYNTFVQYTAPPALRIGKDYTIFVNLAMPRELADEFMDYSERSPNDVWEIISGELFHGLFGVERDYEGFLGVVSPAKRTGVMYFRNITDDTFKGVGIEYGKPYISSLGGIAYYDLNRRSKDLMHPNLLQGLDILPMIDIQPKKIVYTPS